MTHYLLDTNILLRSRDIASPDYNLVDRTIRYLISNDHRCFITSQVLIEFWVVATRPFAVNGLGWTPEEAERAVQMLINQFEWLEETPDIFRLWLNLAVLSNFALAQVFYILQRLYTGRAFVGKAVQREIQAGINSASTSASLRNRTKLQEINQALDEGWLQTPSDAVNPNDDAVDSVNYSPPNNV